MASSSNSSMMSTIDSLKDKMSDEVYLALCEKMKELHTEHQQVVEPTMIPVRIWYMVARTFNLEIGDAGGVDHYRIEPVQQIVMMTRDKMERMKSKIDGASRHTGLFCFNNPVNIDLYEGQAPCIGGVDPYDLYGAEVYRIEEM